MDELITFLRAQLDNDGRWARGLGGESWTAQPTDAHGMRRVTVDHSVEYVVACTLATRGVHIARWDPARVLAEIEAKRRILDDHEQLANGACNRCCEFGMYSGSNQAWPCTTVRLLALPYADRDGYREEWRPAH